mmetsp:Transcript_22797/g.78060  ORF Transcript_22797/g.78060 Transcript_22797/m.78060 type:complete len:372 (-) Transcript_22797:387-1502(-)
MAAARLPPSCCSAFASASSATLRSTAACVLVFTVTSRTKPRSFPGAARSTRPTCCAKSVRLVVARSMSTQRSCGSSKPSARHPTLVTTSASPAARRASMASRILAGALPSRCSARIPRLQNTWQRTLDWATVVQKATVRNGAGCASATLSQRPAARRTAAACVSESALTGSATASSFVFSAAQSGAACFCSFAARSARTTNAGTNAPRRTRSARPGPETKPPNAEPSTSSRSSLCGVAVRPTTRVPGRSARKRSERYESAAAPCASSRITRPNCASAGGPAASSARASRSLRARRAWIVVTTTRPAPPTAPAAAPATSCDASKNGAMAATVWPASTARLTTNSVAPPPRSASAAATRVLPPPVGSDARTDA